MTSTNPAPTRDLHADPPVGETDRVARRLALITVVVPALGFAAAVWTACLVGFTLFDLLVLAGMYLITSLGVEGGFHRMLSHRAFALRGPLLPLLAIAGCMAAQGPVLFWVATHRIHHAFTDRDGDPHSPRPLGPGRLAVLSGLWHAHAGWLFTVRRTGWSKHVKDLFADRRLVRVDRYYFVWVALGLALPALLGLVVVGGAWGALDGLLWGGLARIFLLDQATWSVNSIGHTWGARQYRTRDTSTNVGALAVVTVGGSWHNNHHAVPSSAFNRHRWWQLDLTGATVGLLERLGLATDVRRSAPATARKERP